MIQDFLLQGPELIRVSRFYKEAKDGKFVNYLYSDAKTLYESFRRGSKESSKCLFPIILLLFRFFGLDAAEILLYDCFLNRNNNLKRVYFAVNPCGIFIIRKNTFFSQIF